MKNILVPCDFSDAAMHAFKFAVEIANKSKGQIHLVHVVEIPVMHDTLLMPTLNFEEAFLRETKERAEKDFNKMKAKWAVKGPKINTQVLFGPMAPTILRLTEEKKADLVVMGTKGASGVQEIFVGSNTEKIVRRSPVPVMAIKKSTKITGIKNLVFPTTLQMDEEELTMKVKALQDFFNAKLHLLFVNTPANFKKDLETHKELDAFAKRFMLKNYTLNVYNDYAEEDGIRNFVDEVKGDIVAMSTHGRRGLNHLMAGSIAEDVVNHLECPIWTWRHPNES
ncbi:MAG: universal stress protein [Cyclobacteriaceae bacterium]